MRPLDLKILAGIYFAFHIFIVAEAIPSFTLIPTRCNSVEPASAGMIILSAATENYSAPLNCSITMTATSSSHRLRFGFNTGYEEVGIVHNPNEALCSRASIQLFDGPNITSTALTNQICGNLTSTESLSSGDTLTLLVLSVGGNSTALNFTAHYTSFTEDSDCGSDFKCSNDRCISNDMLCDSTLINNCGDFSDNSRGPPANCSDETTTATIAGTNNETTSATTQPGDSDIAVYVAAAIGGAATLYFLHWLLFRPGWLVWRLGCLRHTRCCRKCLDGSSGKNSVDAARPLTTDMNSIEVVKKQPGSTGLADHSGTPVTTKEVSPSPFVEGISRQKHIFSLDS